MIRQIFNEVLRQKDCTPEAWRRMRIRVIYKKGDVEEAGNYRTICTLPASHTQISTLLYDRLYSRLDSGQSADQGGFRRSYQNFGSSSNVQIVRAEMSGAECQNVDRDG